MSETVFKYFEQISRIPRCSGNEKEISDYMVSFAKGLGLEVIQDDVYNIIIKKDGSKGYENAPTVILQGHLDMVCEKENDVSHDFSKDPLDLYRDGDLMRAKGTTLGADNGVALAYQMAILASDTIDHPPLEAFMTIDEERGMSGVANMNPEYLDGKILINLDSEEEGEFLVSCAGGVRTELKLKYKPQAPDSEREFYMVQITGLKGGHSGIEIIYDRANSNVLMGRLLSGLAKEIDFQLASVEGGSQDNVITRDTRAVLGINKGDKEKLLEMSQKWESLFKDEYSVQDPGIQILMKPLLGTVDYVLPEAIKEKTISLLVLHPNGVKAMSMDMEDLVETSLNLGVVETTPDYVSLSSALRSSVASRKELLLSKIEELAKVTGAEFSRASDYPAWEYEADSPIRQLAIRVYEQMNKKSPKINAIHAGLECGFIAEKLPGIDMISFGPNIRGAHTPDENLSISSTKNVWEFLKELLKHIT